jgi:hypothetical protein
MRTNTCGAKYRAPHCKIGDKIYCICELDGEKKVDGLTITDIGQRFIYASCFDPPENDVGNALPWEKVGEEFFFSYEEAINFIGAGKYGEDA